MEGDAMTLPTVFISYSHEDEVWKKLLHPQLGVLEQQDRITIWDDRQIDPGGKWFNEIKQVMDRAAVTVCLISADYLSSDFCTKEEIPYLLERREKDGMILIPVLLRPCLWKAVPWLKNIQMLPRDGKSVSRDFKDDPDVVFDKVAETIFEIIDNPGYKPPEPTPLWSPPGKIDIRRLPMTGEELFGRQKQLEMLDQAWELDHTHIVSFVAWGGVGKSTLVNKWLERMEADNYRGASRVFAWSFYSQGTSEKVTSADLFISEALDWFGDSDPSAGSPWDKGARLAELIRKNKTLLVLDGLEPLQSHYDYERGKIKDPALATVISELARQNPGLCVVTTREAVADLRPFQETVYQEDLELISAEAGRALLRVSGVQGTDLKLERTVRDFGNHALAVSLLGVYLHEIPGHDISNASGIPELDIPVKAGRHPRRMIAAFERRFGEGPEVEVLRMLGLFDRPADAGAIAAIAAAPAIPNLTEHIQVLSEANWLRLINRLREKRLIASGSRHQPDILDAHPLVREHFSEQLRDEYPEAWQEGNNRLYEHLKQTAEEYPDTIEEMIPLYSAVAHGCQAGRHQDAMDELYWHRIQRGDELFNLHKLGAFGADLVAIFGFFDSLWDKPVAGLTEADKSYVLNVAGFDLRALGRLKDAVQPMKAGLEADIALEGWKNAAIAAGNLSELYLTIGDIALALEYANKSVDLADKSGDAFQRMSKRTTLADALHQAGNQSEAESLFHEAEEMQKDRQPEYPFLYSLWGFRYCNLMLSRGEYQEVLSRAETALQIVLNGSKTLLDIALNNLSLGRAHLLQALQEGSQDFAQAAEHLNQAVDGLRQAGQQDDLPRGLLARAELYRAQSDFERAQHDLDEAMTIAERGEMGLHQADCHLEYARMYLAMGRNDDARKRLDTAREMVEKTGYHRRDKDIVEIDEQI
ncbi:MAG TPA: toll/interleukin-1 receptor domain-containing protein [Methanosarcinales archaeon]|nr:toll/interleukin-1 receptor domain-containing protein [Methanosarcinales archaeon]